MRTVQAHLLIFAIMSTLSIIGDGQSSLAQGVMVRELDSPAKAGTAEPNLTRGRNGTIYMSWIERHPDTSHTLYISSLDTNGWSSPRRVQSGRGWFVNWADFPAIAVGQSGAMLASWLEKNGEDTYAYDVRLTRSSDGGATWGTPFTPHDDKTQTEHGFVSLTALPDGEFAAIWLDGREMIKPDGPMTLRYARIDANGKLRDEAVVDARVCDCCQTSMARCGDGSLVAIYRDRSDDEVRDISVVRRTESGWTTPAPIHSDHWRIAGCPVNGPALDAFDRTVAASWFTLGQDDSARVYVSFSRDCGATFGEPIRVDLGSSLGRVDICLLDHAQAGVVWLQPDGDKTRIMMRLVHPSGDMSVPVSVATTSANRESGFPHIVYDGEKFILVWTDPSSGPRVRTAALQMD